MPEAEMVWTERYMTVLGWTNKVGMPVMWDMQQSAICEKYRMMQMTYGNPQAQAMSMVAGMALQNVGMSGVPDCGANPQCMTAVGMRCNWYQTMAMLYKVVLACMVFGLLSCVMSGLYVWMSPTKSSRRYALGGHMFALCCTLTGNLTFVVATDSMLKDFGMMCYHPYLSLTFGCWLNLGGNLLIFVATLFCFVSQMPKKKDGAHLAGGGAPMGGMGY